MTAQSTRTLVRVGHLPDRTVWSGTARHMGRQFKITLPRSLFSRPIESTRHTEPWAFDNVDPARAERHSTGFDD